VSLVGLHGTWCMVPPGGETIPPPLPLGGLGVDTADVCEEGSRGGACAWTG